jgi:anti-anti-sigma factor
MSVPFPPHDPDDPVEAREQEVLDEIADLDDQLTIRVSRQDGIAVLRLSGELDVATAEAFGARLIEVLDGGAERVIVDLSATPFIDSKGLAVFLIAARRLPGGVAVVSPRERVTRLFQATGLAHQLRLTRTLPEALQSRTGSE